MSATAPQRVGERLIELLTPELERFPEIELAILYGSRAGGTARADSDLDLAVAKDAREQLSAERLVDLSLAASRATGVEVQVRDLARADGLFLKQVLTSGRLLLCRTPAVRAELIIRMLDFDADMLPNIRMIRRATRERFLEIDSIRRCLERITAHTPPDAEALAADYDKQDIVSVNLQRAIQLSVDLAAHLIAERGSQAPLTMAETFTVLADLAVIDRELAQRLRRAVGFRNISVHEYERIDWHRVYELITTRLEDFRTFVAAVVKAREPRGRG